MQFALTALGAMAVSRQHFRTPVRKHHSKVCTRRDGGREACSVGTALSLRPQHSKPVIMPHICAALSAFQKAFKDTLKLRRVWLVGLVEIRPMLQSEKLRLKTSQCFMSPAPLMT